MVPGLTSLIGSVRRSPFAITPMAATGKRCIKIDFPAWFKNAGFSGNTRNLSADPDRSRVGAGFLESLAAVLGLQFRANRVYPRSSSQ